jgi:hypothetical protein
MPTYLFRRVVSLRGGIDTNVQWMRRVLGCSDGGGIVAFVEEPLMRTVIPDPRPVALDLSSSCEVSQEHICALDAHLEDRQYRLLHRAYHAASGVVSCDQLAHLLRRRVDQPISAVARWIVAREVVSYAWRSQTMLPLFQFEMPRVMLRPTVTRVVTELREVYGDWGLATWFVESNAWLDGATPVALIETDPRAVFEAACADRCVAGM